MSKFDELTAFEVAQAEQACGMSVTSMGDKSVPKVALMGALAWVHNKRAEPTLTYGDYMRRVSFNEPADYLFDDDEDEAGDDLGDEDATFPEPLAAVAPAGDGEGPVLPADRDLAV